jgi:hypothetical protein
VAYDIPTGAAMVLAKKYAVELSMAYHALGHIRVLNPPHALEAVVVLAKGAAQDGFLTVHDCHLLAAARRAGEVVFVSTNRYPPVMTVTVRCVHMA